MLHHLCPIQKFGIDKTRQCKIILLLHVGNVPIKQQVTTNTYDSTIILNGNFWHDCTFLITTNWHHFWTQCNFV